MKNSIISAQLRIKINLLFIQTKNLYNDKQVLSSYFKCFEKLLDKFTLKIDLHKNKTLN